MKKHHYKNHRKSKLRNFLGTFVKSIAVGFGFTFGVALFIALFNWFSTHEIVDKNAITKQQPIKVTVVKEVVAKNDQGKVSHLVKAKTLPSTQSTSSKKVVSESTQPKKPQPEKPQNQDSRKPNQTQPNQPDGSKNNNLSDVGKNINQPVDRKVDLNSKENSRVAQLNVPKIMELSLSTPILKD